MAVSKVTLNGTTLMDLTQDSVVASVLRLNETATGADGEPVTGAYVPPTFTTQEKSVSPTESEQVVTPDSGKDGLSKVTVGAISGTYVGSAVEQNDSTDLTVSGATVTVPAGHYATQATKSVASGSAKTPATTITANPTITVNTTTGVITATTSASKSVTPTVSAGYVSSGTAGTVSVSGSATSQLTVYDGTVV